MVKLLSLILVGLFLIPSITLAKEPQKIYIEYGMWFGLPEICAIRLAISNKYFGVQANLSYLSSDKNLGRYCQRTDLRINLVNTEKYIGNSRFFYGFLGTNTIIYTRNSGSGVGLDFGVGLSATNGGCEFGFNLPLIKSKLDDSAWNYKVILGFTLGGTF